MELTDAQWDLLAPLFQPPPRRPDGRGRPWRDPRAVLEGVLWVLRSGARWKDLPATFPPYQTCHRRFQQWQRQGVLRAVLQALTEALLETGRLDLREGAIDGTFSSAKKGAARSVRPSVGKARKSWRSAKATVSRSRSTSRARRRPK
jgi:transposase